MPRLKKDRDFAILMKIVSFVVTKKFTHYKMNTLRVIEDALRKLKFLRKRDIIAS